MFHSRGNRDLGVAFQTHPGSQASSRGKQSTPWKEGYEQTRQHIKKQRYYFSTKVHLVKAMVFPVVMYECESWSIKKAECQRIDAFELQCWRRLLRVPCTARISNQFILKDQSWVFNGRTDAEDETPILLANTPILM